MSIFRNDKVILIKEYDKLNAVGATYEVANITETSIVIRDAGSKIALAAIDIGKFNEYFKKPEEVKGWTNWIPILERDGKTIGCYRTNQKKVQVRIGMGDNTVCAEASCNNHEDTFDLFFGIQLAYCRCQIKELNRQKKVYDDILHGIKNMINNNNVLISNMINSLV